MAFNLNNIVQISSLAELPNINNIEKWAKEQMQSFENEYVGSTYDQYNIAAINAKIRDIALTVERVTGEKPEWWVKIYSAYEHMELNSDLK